MLLPPGAWTNHCSRFSHPFCHVDFLDFAGNDPKSFKIMKMQTFAMLTRRDQAQKMEEV
jgi:hypothetical protein